MNSSRGAGLVGNDSPRAFLNSTGWGHAVCEPLAGDASVRRYYRLRLGDQTAILMDASLVQESVPAFLRIAEHLIRLGLSAPAILARDENLGCLLLEDFGDDLFTRRLENQLEAETHFTLATDVLIALHQHPEAIPPGLRAYHPEKMLDDIDLFLEWRTPGSDRSTQAAFRAAWREVLPKAHEVPTTLLLRDYHVANLMWLPDRQGVRRAGLLDFQDAYQGPITYDLVSLLEDARRDLPAGLKERMLARYLAQFPSLDPSGFTASLAILGAQRHTRVLAIFERLSQREGKHDYKNLHSKRVQRLLWQALDHPILAPVRAWFETYGR